MRSGGLTQFYTSAAQRASIREGVYTILPPITRIDFFVHVQQHLTQILQRPKTVQASQHTGYTRTFRAFGDHPVRPKSVCALGLVRVVYKPPVRVG